MKEPILSQEEAEAIFQRTPKCIDGTFNFIDYAALIESALLEKLFGEPVGQAVNMPGTDGITMAAFRADDVPVGTSLYALKDRQS